MNSEKAGEIRNFVGYVPVTVVVVAGIAHWFAVKGVYPDPSPTSILVVLNPIYYAASLFLHIGGWSHYWSNILLFVPLGVVLTWLTSNRHVLLVIVVSHFLALFTSVLTVRQGGFGMSGVVFALFGATLVRGTGLARGSLLSTEGLKITLGFLLGVFAVLLYTVGVVDRSSDIAHWIHAYGFVFGGAVEAIYVFSEHGESDTEEDEDYTSQHGA